MDFMDALKEATNYTHTDNGALAHQSTLNACYDLFAFGGAMRGNNAEDIIDIFEKAYLENKELALKTLFYLRDVRGGQGERRFFRTAFKYVCENDPDTAIANLHMVPFFGRWDDLWEATRGTKVYIEALTFIASQLTLDYDLIDASAPSLCAKWAPSINCANATRKLVAKDLCRVVGWSEKGYRRMLSVLRSEINVVEKLMSEGRWDEIKFDQIPSKAGLRYKNAFARHDYERYSAFANSDKTKVNAGALYPYEVIKKALKHYMDAKYYNTVDVTDKKMIQKYWDNLPDYIGEGGNAIAVVDTSGSMTCNFNGTRPIDVAISLGIYLAERNKGAFANKYISFASRPQLIDTTGKDICRKAGKIYETNLVDNTNLEAVFRLILETAQRSGDYDSMPERVIIISDMQIDEGCYDDYGTYERETTRKRLLTTMEGIHMNYAAAGVPMPKLVYWNVNAAKPVVLDMTSEVSCVSGCSPVIFKSILSGKSGYDLFLETVCADRYNGVIVV